MMDRRVSDPASVSPGTTAATQRASPSGSAASIHATQSHKHHKQQQQQQQQQHRQHPPVSRSALHISLSKPDPSTVAALSASSLSPGILPGGGSVGSPHATCASLGSPSATAVETSPPMPPSGKLNALALSDVDAPRGPGGGPPPPPPPPQLPSSHFKDLHPGNFTPTHESRRRNAEQREAVLRADVLLKEVQPNRVFCGLCEKWVQLRQDSSYCAYPWVQHRQKCVARQ